MDKFKHNVLAKVIDDDKKTVTNYASTFGWDRDGERFVKGCWELENYRLNPVVLWGHDTYNLPIGKNLTLVEDDHGLLATTQFDKGSDLAMDVFRLFKDGILNAFSVGFIRKSFQMEDHGNGQKGLAITKAELYEYSPVTVPSNPGALVSREAAEIARKRLGENVIELIQTKSFGEQFLVVSPAPQDEPPPAADGDDELEPAIKHLINLAKTCKGGKLNEQKRGLITQAVTVFSEILAESPDEVNPEQLKGLKDALIAFAGVVADVRPELAQAIQKAISQIDSAISRAA